MTILSSASAWLRRPALALISALLLPLAGTAATQYTYDELNRLTKVVYDDGKSVAYTYDAAGNLVTEQRTGVSRSAIGIDTTIASLTPTQNLGGNPRLWVAGASSGSAARTLIRFDHLALPPGATRVLLNLYGEGGDASRPSTIEVYRATQTWIEEGAGGATWNAQPAHNAGRAYASQTVPGGTAAGWVQWDITALVKEWQTSVFANQGLLLDSKLVPTSGIRYFTSSDAADNRPFLSIDTGTEGMARLDLITEDAPLFRWDATGGNHQQGADPYLSTTSRYWQGRGGGISVSVLKVDAAKVPVSAAKVWLNFICYSSHNIATATVQVFRVTSPWEEMTVTWNTQPTVAEMVGQVPVPDVGAYRVDITSLVKQWQAGQVPNHGLMLDSSWASPIRMYYSINSPLVAGRPYVSWE